jgi:hypothetical protein
LEEPSFVRLPESIEATQGDTVRFSCQATGKPIPSIVWFREGEQKLPGVPKHKVEIAEKKTEEKNLVESILTVKDVKLNVHDGAYVVHAQNEAGAVLHEAQLVGKPPFSEMPFCIVTTPYLHNTSTTLKLHFYSALMLDAILHENILTTSQSNIQVSPNVRCLFASNNISHTFTSIPQLSILISHCISNPAPCHLCDSFSWSVYAWVHCVCSECSASVHIHSEGG